MPIPRLQRHSHNIGSVGAVEVPGAEAEVGDGEMGWGAWGGEDGVLRGGGGEDGGEEG